MSSFLINKAISMKGVSLQYSIYSEWRCITGANDYWLYGEKLTVSEGETRSDIIIRDSCVKAANKQDSTGREAKPSHAYCPHASSEPTANLQYLLLRLWLNSWRPSLTRVHYLLPLRLSLCSSRHYMCCEVRVLFSSGMMPPRKGPTWDKPPGHSLPSNAIGQIWEDASNSN